MKIQKHFTCLSCLKSFSIREVIGRLCIEEVRVDLEHLCSCSRKQCRIFHGSFSVNNYPLVQFHCIIKIMCQGLPLGCLHLLDGLYGAGQKLWLYCAILHILQEHQTIMKLFALYLYTKCLFFLFFQSF